MEMPVSIATIAEWEEALRNSYSQPLLVFKHSTQCSISAGAYEELANWLEDARSLSISAAMVLIPEFRAVSDAVEEKLGLKHESPQIILVDSGNVSWHASHWRITYSTLDEHLGTHCEK